MILPPIKPMKSYNYFVAECKNCGWKKIYRSDNIFIPDKCPKCKNEIILKKASLKDMLKNPLDLIF